MENEKHGKTDLQNWLFVNRHEIDIEYWKHEKVELHNLVNETGSLSNIIVVHFNIINLLSYFLFVFLITNVSNLS